MPRQRKTGLLKSRIAWRLRSAAPACRCVRARPAPRPTTTRGVDEALVARPAEQVVEAPLPRQFIVGSRQKPESPRHFPLAILDAWSAGLRKNLARNCFQRDMVETGARMRVDSTVTETHILAPADSRLLYDCVRVMTRLLGRPGNNSAPTMGRGSSSPTGPTPVSSRSGVSGTCRWPRRWPRSSTSPPPSHCDVDEGLPAQHPLGHRRPHAGHAGRHPQRAVPHRGVPRRAGQRRPQHVRDAARRQQGRAAPRLGGAAGASARWSRSRSPPSRAASPTSRRGLPTSSRTNTTTVRRPGRSSNAIAVAAAHRSSTRPTASRNPTPSEAPAPATSGGPVRCTIRPRSTHRSSATSRWRTRRARTPTRTSSRSRLRRTGDHWSARINRGEFIRATA